MSASRVEDFTLYTFHVATTLTSAHRYVASFFALAMRLSTEVVVNPILYRSLIAAISCLVDFERKTYIVSGLVHDAVRAGFRASVMTMDDLVSVLRLKDLTPTCLAAYNRLLKLHLLAIDDIMMFPLKKEEATAFFNLVNALHERTSIIVTTNKSPTEWAERLDDEVLAAAILDRLMYRCQIVKLAGESYRMCNRKTIFKD